jgi:hypothetical protein
MVEKIMKESTILWLGSWLFIILMGAEIIIFRYFSDLNLVLFYFLTGFIAIWLIGVVAWLEEW